MIKLDILVLLFLQKHLMINGRHHVLWLLHTHVSPMKRKIYYWYNSIIEKMVHIWISLVLSIMDLYNNHKICNPASNPWPRIAFSCHINLVFFHVELFLSLSLSFIALTCFQCQTEITPHPGPPHERCLSRAGRRRRRRTTPTTPFFSFRMGGRGWEKSVRTNRVEKETSSSLSLPA